MENKKIAHKKVIKIQELSVVFFHNIISPYRIPLFKELSKRINLKVYFGNATKKDRIWKVERNLKFRYEVLRNIGTIPMLFTINPYLPIKLFQENYDIYIGADSNLLSTQITFLISKIRRKPFILWIVERDYSWEQSFPLLKHLLYKIMKTISIIISLHSDACVVPGDEARKRLKRIGVLEDRIFIAPNSIPIKPFRQKYEMANDKALRKKLGISSKMKIILSLCYLRELKGLQYLIRAFNKLMKERNDIFLIIVGDGPYINDLKNLQEKYLITNMLFTGYIPNKFTPIYYKMADIFILPSLIDSWGFVINEAMICEKPIITTEDVGAKELIIENGVVIPSGNVNKLYEALKIMLSNNSLLEKMGRKSWENIKLYSIENEVKGFLNAIIYVSKFITQV